MSSSAKDLAKLTGAQKVAIVLLTLSDTDAKFFFFDE
jgi:flagellar motor switch protein FliG